MPSRGGLGCGSHAPRVYSRLATGLPCSTRSRTSSWWWLPTSRHQPQPVPTSRSQAKRGFGCSLGSWPTPEVRPSSGKLWWEFALPQYVRFLRHDRARLQLDHSADLEQEVQRRSEAEARSAERAREMDEQNGEIDELRDAPERAKGREEALHAVIQRCRWA